MKCPLCDKTIVDDMRREGMNIVQCSEQVHLTYGAPISHYARDYDLETETMIVHPYKIVTSFHWSEEITSRIFKYNPPKDMSIKRRYLPRFKGLATVPRVHPDTSEKLMERIKLILLFL